MHDRSTVAFDIKWPWKKSYRMKDGTRSKSDYRPSFITIWHEDPEADGSDDSCGWFMRARHGNKDVLTRIVNRFEQEWDVTHELSPGRFSSCGWFLRESGDPRLSVQGIVLNMVFFAACEMFGCDGRTNWVKARRYVQKNLADILHLAENNTESLFDGITQKYGDDGYAIASGWKRKQMRVNRIEGYAGTIYSWMLRKQRPWYRHPRWHIWHWRLQIHGVQAFKRWAFSRCCKCGKRFRYGESPITNQWDGGGPRWFRGERDVFHMDCSEPGSSPKCGDQ